MIKQDDLSIILDKENLLKQSVKSSFIRDLLPHFLLKFKSKNTRLNYKRNLEEFFEFCSFVRYPVSDLKDLTETHMQFWQRSLEAKKNKDGSFLTQSTIAAKLSAVCSLCVYAYKRKIIPTNPAEFVQRPTIRKTRGSTTALREEEMHKILDALRMQIKTFADRPKSKKNKIAWLHYAIIATLFTVGMRVSELCALKIFDFQINVGKNELWESGQCARLRLSLKGGQQHSPLIPEELTLILKNYLVISRSLSLSDDPLFALQDKPRASAVSRHFITKLVARLAKMVGIQKSVSSHSCRASVASLLHKKGVPVGEIQDLLGHRDIKTTMLYVRTLSEENQSAAMKIGILKKEFND
ncbi:MAG: tyrosine-type recombinase/integrase [Silvanigrellaceae bacterium]|nr:tyrosine-type recombinase/integrase [Silvanigrellaceae bacterium]